MLNFIPKLFKLSTISLLSLCIILLASCYTKRVAVQDTSTLEGLKAMATTKYKRQQKNQKKKMSKIRMMALKETALSIGAQAGLAYQATIIDKALTRQARQLDAIYDFNLLVIKHNILPPVLLEGRNTFNLANEQAIRISDRTYKLAKQARFISTVPNWRQYLWMDYKKPDAPHSFLLPKSRQEKDIWCTYVTQGWNNGIEQANTILEESIARIKEDFKGMILYRKLLAMHMVSAPYVSHTDLGVTGDASEMHIDDRVLRITALPALNTDSSQWRAVVTEDQNTLEKLSEMEKRANESEVRLSNDSWKPIIPPTNIEK